MLLSFSPAAFKEKTLEIWDSFLLGVQGSYAFSLAGSREKDKEREGSMNRKRVGI